MGSDEHKPEVLVLGLDEFIQDHYFDGNEERYLDSDPPEQWFKFSQFVIVGDLEFTMN